MTSKDNRSADAAPSTSSDRLLRERAEEVVRENAISSPEGQEPLSLQETRHTLQELRVHQIELEMQNEELRRTQVELDRERERYFDLYDLAPVGYCTIYETGMIKEANLTAGNLLGVTRSALVRQPFTAFIQKEDLDIYYLHNKPLFETGAPQVYELRMVKKDTVPFWARLEATRAEDADGTMLCRVTVTDITKRKKAEEEIKSNLEELKRSKALIQQSNSLLEAIMASPNNIVVFALDKDYRYLAFNQNHQKTMLAIWGADIEIGANMLDYITYPADRNKAKLNFDRALAGEHFVIIEAYGDDDLQRRYYEDHYSPIREEGNSFIGLTVFLFDITDRRIMEKALQESEQRFRHVSELITDFAYSCIKSPDGPFKIDWLTGAVEKITGYTANEIRDLTCWRPLVIEDDLPLFDHDVVGLAPGEWARSEIRIRKKDGEIVWLASFAQCFTDQHLPAYHRIYGACRDITERKLAEAYREMGREVLQILNAPGDMSDAMQSILATLKTQTGFHAVGISLQDGEDFPYFAQEGFSRDLLRTENTLMCRDKDGSVRLECTCGLIISGKTDPTHPFFTPGGSFWINDSSLLLHLASDQDPRLHPRNNCIHQGYASMALVPIRNQDKIVGLIQFNDRRKGRFTLDSIELLEGIASHIGEALMRRSADEALRVSEEKFKKAFFTSPDLVSISRLNDGMFVSVNKGFTEITGYKEEDIIGKTSLEINIWKDLEDRRMIVEELQATGEVRDYEARFITKKGEIYGLMSASIIELDGVPHILNITRDITERKRAEQALVKKSEDLARSNADLAQFAYVASHDLQEPLRTITRFVQLLEKRYHGKLDQDADEFIGFVVSGTKRMQQIIDDLLAYSRVNTRREPPHIMKIDDAIQRAMQNINYVQEEAGGTIIYGEMPSIIADETQMTQLFQNLIGNALKFHGEEAPRVEISALRKGDDWIFSVRDNGIGIDPQYKDRIFEIFQRLHTCEEYPGTGIGLAIAKKIVERHRGHIWVESQPGEGSTFNFTLPVDAKNAGVISAKDNVRQNGYSTGRR